MEILRLDSQISNQEFRPRPPTYELWVLLTIFQTWSKMPYVRIPYNKVISKRHISQIVGNITVNISTANNA
jgi:hypothetical protein